MLILKEMRSGCSQRVLLSLPKTKMYLLSSETSCSVVGTVVVATIGSEKAFYTYVLHSHTCTCIDSLKLCFDGFKFVCVCVLFSEHFRSLYSFHYHLVLSMEYSGYVVAFPLPAPSIGMTRMSLSVFLDIFAFRVNSHELCGFDVYSSLNRLCRIFNTGRVRKKE